MQQHSPETKMCSYLSWAPIPHTITRNQCYCGMAQQLDEDAILRLRVRVQESAFFCST